MTTIKVATIFEKGKQRPVWFIHEGRKYVVKEITYEWQSKEGTAKVYHYAVSDGANVFELVFNDKEMVWQLETV